MRVLRNVLSALLVAVLGLGVVAAVPATAVAKSSKPKRIIDEEPPFDNQVSFNAFKLKGVITQQVLDPLTGQPYVDPATGLPALDPATGEIPVVPYAGQKVKLQKKKCKKVKGKKGKKCRWKTVKKIKTNDSGKFKTKIFAPRKGKWKWRINVKASDGFRTTKGTTWTTSFR